MGIGAGVGPFFTLYDSCADVPEVARTVGKGNVVHINGRAVVKLSANTHHTKDFNILFKARQPPVSYQRITSPTVVSVTLKGTG